MQKNGYSHRYGHTIIILPPTQVNNPSRIGQLGYGCLQKLIKRLQQQIVNYCVCLATHHESVKVIPASYVKAIRKTTTTWSSQSSIGLISQNFKSKQLYIGPFQKIPHSIGDTVHQLQYNYAGNLMCITKLSSL